MGVASDRERNSCWCLGIEHHYKETYAGYECEYCHDFIPYGCEPWMPIDEDEDDDPTINRTCETCGGEFWDGGTSCSCLDDDETEHRVHLTAFGASTRALRAKFRAFIQPLLARIGGK